MSSAEFEFAPTAPKKGIPIIFFFRQGSFLPLTTGGLIRVRRCGHLRRCSQSSMSGEATKKSPRITISERITALHRARVSFCVRAKTWNKTAWRKHPMANPTRTAMPLRSVVEPSSVWREKKNPITKLMILKNVWPMNEHQKALLSENWTRPINLPNENSRIVPTAMETAKSRMNIKVRLLQKTRAYA